jgi:hypothetical protein
MDETQYREILTALCGAYAALMNAGNILKEQGWGCFAEHLLEKSTRCDQALTPLTAADLVRREVMEDGTPAG